VTEPAPGLSFSLHDDELPADAAEAIYRHLGWRYGGSIPGYAVTPDGVPHATVYLYKTVA